MVLGHTECGAIKGAVDNAKLGHLTGLLAQIRPSLERLHYRGTPSSKDQALVQRVAERNVQDAVTRLNAAPVLAALVQAGQLRIGDARCGDGADRLAGLKLGEARRFTPTTQATQANPPPGAEISWPLRQRS